MKVLALALFFVHLVVAQNCSSIYTAGNKNMDTFSTAGFPVASQALPNSVCGLSPQATSCVYSEAFSCLVRKNGQFVPISCPEAFSKRDFPLCYGTVEFSADCDTLECCQDLNTNLLPYVKQQIGTLYDTSYYYYMEFYSGGGSVIDCQSFSDGYDTCTQYLNYAGSSNWATCNTLYNQFTGNADDMAFNLF